MAVKLAIVGHRFSASSDTDEAPLRAELADAARLFPRLAGAMLVGLAVSDDVEERFEAGYAVELGSPATRQLVLETLRLDREERVRSIVRIMSEHAGRPSTS